MAPENLTTQDDSGTPGEPLAEERSGGPRTLTSRERRRRFILLAILLLLLALLAYATYYFFENRRLPVVQMAAPEEVIEPPQYLYSITGTGDNELSRPVGLGVAEDGRVYVVDFGKRRISVFTNDGRYLFSFAEVDDGVLRNPVHMWIKGGEVWVTDRRLQAILVFDLEGQFLRRFEPQSEELTWTPLALAFSGDGELRVTDVGATQEHQVHYFSSEGSRTVTFGRTFQALSLDDTPGGFFFPNGLAVAADGRVYVSDGNNRRIQVFDENGEFSAFVDTSGVPRGIAIDAQQRLYAVDAIAHTVDIYDLDGKRLAQFGSQGFGPGQFNYPNDVTIDRRGRIYVTDRDNDQVQVWGWPVAQPPTVAPPTSLAGWLACLLPLLLLPLLLLLRKIRIVVTPDFVEALIVAEQVKATADKRRLRLVAPEEDRALYEGRMVEDVDLGTLIQIEDHSESDAHAIMERLDVSEREASFLSMALRARALGTEDREMRKNAILAEVRVVGIKEFVEDYLGGGRS
jgi:DNA-binding beta-propeller fold protein YncE